MRAVIIVDDHNVSVDGEWAPVDCADLAAEGQHAVQWYGSYGEVEHATEFDPETKSFSRKPNEIITDFGPYEPYVTQWRAAMAKKKAEELAHAEQRPGDGTGE